MSRTPLSEFLHLLKGPLLGGLPHKKPFCVGALSGAWSLNGGPLSEDPPCGGLLSGASLSVGPFELELP